MALRLLQCGGDGVLLSALRLLLLRQIFGSHISKEVPPEIPRKAHFESSSLALILLRQILYWLSFLHKADIQRHDEGAKSVATSCV